jgi:hypothetical protein
MTHHHDHDHHHDHGHDHDHDHDRGHGHGHHHEIKSGLTFKEKMIKLLDHWVKHNHDHAANYQDWAEKAKTNGLPEIGVLLEDVHALTLQIDDTFKKAAAMIR